MRYYTLVVIACAMIMAGYAVLRDTRGENYLPPAPSAFDDRIAALDRTALDEAFRSQVAHLYVTWMKDPTGQPERALQGYRRARLAYIEAMAGIEEREKRLHPH